MAEKSKDIKQLVKLRQQRPAFSRMISWDFSQTANTQAVKRKKAKKNKNTGTSEGVDDDDGTEGSDERISDLDTPDSSDYETAEDDIDKLTDTFSTSCTSEAFTAMGSSGIFDSLDQELDPEALEDDSDYDDDLDDTIGDINNVSDSAQLHPGRRRRLSKKQKKKRSKLTKITYANEFLSLGNVCDTVEDIDSVFGELEGTEFDVNRRVPSLGELCLLATRKKVRSNSNRKRAPSGPLPPGIKRQVRSWNQSNKELKDQLSYLQNIVLPSVSEKTKFDGQIMYNGKKNIKWPMRSVWSCHAFPIKDSDLPYPNEKPASFLLMPTLHYKECEANYPYIQFHNETSVALAQVSSVLATTIDLMLPSTTREDKGQGKVNVTDSQSTEVYRVRRALYLRYPYLVETLFDLVLPYVMWARGSVAKATELFKKLIDNQTKCRVKAMYLSEIARMHSQFGDSKSAVTFYKLASETSSVDVKGSVIDKSIDEVTAQTQVLMANTADIGLLTPDKAVESCRYWSGAINLPHPKMVTVLAAMDAFLICHAAHWTEKDWLSEMLCRMESLVGSMSYLHWYQAMILALQGKEKESKVAFRNLRHSNFGLVGETVMSYLGRRCLNPWQPLVDIVTKQKTPIKPLNVLWRAQFQPTLLDNTGPMETQVNHPNLNLRLNELGHVTGDMQMLLPPLRDIALDPYTGSLVINNTPSYTSVWSSIVMERDKYFAKDLTIPTPVLIYGDLEGTNVHMIKPGLEAVWPGHSDDTRTPCPRIHLYWKSGEGHAAKLNIYQELKNYMKKVLCHHYADQLAIKKIDKETYKMAMEFIEVGDRADVIIDQRAITDGINNINNKKKGKSKSKGTSGTSTEKRSTKKQRLQKPLDLISHFEKNYFRMLKEPFVFKRTIVMFFERARPQCKFLMFIDTRNKQGFLKPVILSANNMYWIDQEQLGSDTTQADFFMIYESKYKSDQPLAMIGLTDVTSTIGVCELQFYNEDGICVQALDISDLKLDNVTYTTCHPCVIGPKCYVLNQDRTSIWHHIIGLEDDTAIEDKVIWSVAPYWAELSPGSEVKVIQRITSLGRDVGGQGQLIALHSSMGLGFMDPTTLEFVTIHMKDECLIPYKMSQDCKILVGQFQESKFLAANSFTSDEMALYRVAMTIENKLMILELSHDISHDVSHGVSHDTGVKVEIVMYVSLPGVVKEVCFVGKNSLLATLTQHGDDDIYYREHVFHFDIQGHLHGVLPCLGRGPKSFLPVYLHGNQEVLEVGGQSSAAGWHVYMRDGQGGIICVKLCS